MKYDIQEVGQLDKGSYIATILDSSLSFHGLSHQSYIIINEHEQSSFLPEIFFLEKIKSGNYTSYLVIWLSHRCKVY
jgi:hypothetical protein